MYVHLISVSVCGVGWIVGIGSVLNVTGFVMDRRFQGNHGSLSGQDWVTGRPKHLHS